MSEMVPKLRLKDSDVRWNVKYLSDFMTFKNGINADKSQYGHGEKYISVLDIIAPKPITYKSIIGLINVSAEILEKNKVIYGDILFQRSSEVREEAGQSNVYLDKSKPATFGGFVIRGRATSEFDPIFFNYLLKSASARKEITNRAGGGTRFNIGQQSLSEVPIHITEDIDEQQKIASFLSAVDEKIEHLERRLELLQTYKRGVMEQLLTGTVRFKEFDGVEWRIEPLGECANCVDNKRVPLNSVERRERRGNIPYWGANGIVDFVDDYLFDETIVLLAEDGGYFDEYRERPIANISHGKAWVNNHAHVLRAKPHVTNEWLYYSLVHKNILAYVNSGTRSKLNKNDMLSIPIAVPAFAEQQKIASFLSALDTKLDAVNTQISQMKRFKKGLLQQMFV